MASIPGYPQQSAGLHATRTGTPDPAADFETGPPRLEWHFSYIFAYAILISVLRLQCSFMMPAVVVAAALVNDSGSKCNTNFSWELC